MLFLYSRHADIYTGQRITVTKFYIFLRVTVIRHCMTAHEVCLMSFKHVKLVSTPCSCYRMRESDKRGFWIASSDSVHTKFHQNPSCVSRIQSCGHAWSALCAFISCTLCKERTKVRNLCERDPRSFLCSHVWHACYVHVHFRPGDFRTLRTGWWRTERSVLQTDRVRVQASDLTSLRRRHTFQIASHKTQYFLGCNYFDVTPIKCTLTVV
jgi:hypothetical protein